MAIVEKEPVREFRGDPRRLARSVLQELIEAREREVQNLGAVECKTFEAYKERFGRVQGLDIAINVCKEVQRKLEA